MKNLELPKVTPHDTLYWVHYAILYFCSFLLYLTHLYLSLKELLFGYNCGLLKACLEVILKYPSGKARYNFYFKEKTSTIAECGFPPFSVLLDFRWLLWLSEFL